MIYLIPIAFHHLARELKAKFRARLAYEEARASGALDGEAQLMATEAYERELN